MTYHHTRRLKYYDVALHRKIDWLSLNQLQTIAIKHSIEDLLDADLSAYLIAAFCEPKSQSQSLYYIFRQNQNLTKEVIPISARFILLKCFTTSNRCEVNELRRAAQIQNFDSIL